MSTSTVYDDVVVGTFEADPELQEAGGRPESVGTKRQPEDCEEEAGAKCAKPAAADGPERIRELRRQIEYYLSDTNLSQDDFFHAKISENPDGWLDASWLLGCSRVVEMGIDDDDAIEAALESSELETRRGEPAEATADGEATTRPELQVRRPGGRALPALLKAGWLRERIAARRKGAVGEPAATEAKEAASGAPPCSGVAVGARVSLRGGEYDGQTGQVLALDGDEATLALEGGDIVTVAAEGLEPDSA